MSELNGVNGDRRRWDGREPIFRDVPFEQSEWAGLYAVLKQVNQLKAELARAQYEATRTAFQNYLEAYEQELAAYAQRRRDDEEYNRYAHEQRRQIAERIEAIRQRWQQEIDRLREELNAADVEAYRRAGLAGITLRGDPLLGIGLPDEFERNATEPHEQSAGTLQNDPTPEGSLQPATNFAQAQPASEPSAGRASLWSYLIKRESEQTTTEQGASQAQASGASPATNLAVPEPAESIEPLTPEEAAHAAHLPTDPSLVIPHWLHWVAPVLIGLAIGQILLVAAGRPIGEWESLAFWIASLGGVLMTLLWYRAVWGVSRGISELYYLFDWGAAKARRAAWLGGLVLLALLILPTALLAFILYLFSAGETRDPLLLVALTLLLVLPLLGLALAGGYFQGRRRVVDDAVQSAVVAAKRNQQREAREQARQEQRQQEQLRLEQERERTEQMRIYSELERERLASERQQREQVGTARSGDGAPHNGAQTPPPFAPPPPADPHQRLRDAFEAISYARGVYANYRRARELMQEEVALYEQMLHDWQPRPIYDYLPPQAEQRIQTLYQQWRDAFGAFLDYIAEAARECKDGEQIQQRIAEFKQTLTS
ncbi:MAG: hypothetical protein N2554_11715 [Fimbriimonadales bacterium]|nr:hypothetical protein [Fimbriimonadales bacterium]